MAEIINLRQARKARDRDARQQEAARNRASSGRTKDEKLRQRAEAERAARLLDGAKREPPARETE